MNCHEYLKSYSHTCFSGMPRCLNYTDVILRRFVTTSPSIPKGQGGQFCPVAIAQQYQHMYTLQSSDFGHKCG